METQKPKSIKNVGLIITIFSGLLIFSNGMGALVFTLLGFGGTSQEPIEMDFLDILFENFALFCLVIVFFGILYFIGGVNLAKYKLWSKNLLLRTSYIFLILLCLFASTGIYYASNESGLKFIVAFFIISVFAFSLPLIFLIRFLKRNEMHFN